MAIHGADKGRRSAMARAVPVLLAVLVAALAACAGRSGRGPVGPGPGAGAGTSTGVGAAAPLPAGDSRQTATVGGREREWTVHVPQAVAGPPGSRAGAPLLIVLHGGGGSGDQMPFFTGFSRIADREGFVVAYPDGVGRNWNDGRDSDFSEAHAAQVDDVGFVSALIDRTAGSASIDRSRVFATGISNGAMMSLRLACEIPDRLAAVAPVAGSGPEDYMDRCRPANPISVVMINGVADPLVPYDGGRVARRLGDRGSVWPVERTARFWSQADRCTGESTPVALPNTSSDDGSAIVQTTWGPCQDSTAVELLTVVGGGHTWPGGVQYLPPALVGTTNRDIDASEYIWAFLASHPSRRGG